MLLVSIFFPIIALVRGADTHDLTVTLDNLRDKNHLELGQTMLLNTIIRNKGNVIEHSVTFQLLINDSQKVSTSIDELSPSSVYTSSYPWNATEGVYYVTAWVLSSAVNSSDTKWVNVCHYADCPLQPSFTVSPSSSNLVTANVLITFDASNSTDPDWANITGYRWVIGYPESETFPITNRTFIKPGPVNATLTIFDSDGNNASTSQILDVTVNPTADFSISNPQNCRKPLDQGPYYVNNTLTFDASNSSAAAGANISSYVWGFDDPNSENNTVTGKVATHTYSIQGHYMVTLNVTDSNNLTGSKTHDVPVGVASPIAYFAISPAPPGPYYVNNTISFNASGSYDPVNYASPNLGIANYAWSFGDNKPATGQNATHSYSGPGNYTVSLTVTNYDNLTSSVNNTVTVTSRVYVTVTDASTGTTDIAYDPGETFTASVTITGVVGLDYFDFTLNYPAGTPPPLLKVENISGEDFPLAAQGYNDSLGQINVGSPTGKHLREGGANGTFTLATITFTVTNPGNCTLYPSSWKLLDSMGNQIPNVSPVQAEFYTEKPVANFTMDKSTPAPNDPVTFNASRSYDPQNPSAYHHGITHYKWNFDDGNITDTNKTTTIQHPYTANGTYNVTLTVWNSAGEQWSTPPTPINVGVIHDVAVTSITLTAADISNGTHTVTLFNIAVNLSNKGNVNETFDVMVYDNNSYDANMIISVPAYNQAQAVFCDTGWNVTGLTGTYTIYANASVTENVYPADNTANKTLQQLGVPYDLDGSGKVGLYELVTLAKAYGSHQADYHFPGEPASPNWNKVVDFLGKGIVLLADLVLVAQHWS